jgi:Kdo2-lipid IVA lauroyltransferase/acyltransferase
MIAKANQNEMQALDRVAYTVIKGAFKVLSRIPRPLMARAAVLVGRLWYALDAYHRNIALNNLQLAFGNELSWRQREQLIRANFIQFATTALQMPSLMRVNRDNLDTYVTFSGIDNVKKALSHGKGLIFLTGHFGNWELMSISSALKLGPAYVLARPLDFRPMDKFLTELRSRSGNTIVDKQDSANRVRRILRDQQMLGILLDQNAAWYEGVYVRFFGQPACTNRGLAMFALRYGTPVVPAYNIRGTDGRYQIIFEPHLPVVTTGDARQDMIKNTALYNRAIEQFIRKAPDHWFWVHRRWRILPIPERARKKLLVEEGIELNINGS